MTDESNERNFKGFSVQFYSTSPDGSTPTSIDERDTGKNKKTAPPEQDGPEKGNKILIDRNALDFCLSKTNNKRR